MYSPIPKQIVRIKKIGVLFITQNEFCLWIRLLWSHVYCVCEAGTESCLQPIINTGTRAAPTSISIHI